MANSSVAVVGLEGSGKTVLMTVLAQSLSSIAGRYYLEPDGPVVVEHIQKTWQTLQGGDWPPSTPPGQRIKLKWNLQIRENNSTSKVPLQLVDAAGQDLRQIFSKDKPLDHFQEHFRSHVNYLRNASIILLVMNIKDYVGNNTADNQAALFGALQSLTQNGQKAALVFTQMDQYQGYIEEFGCLANFLSEKLVYIHNLYLQNSNNYKLFSVSAVKDTEVRQMDDGNFVRVPAPNFSSEGVKELADWIGCNVKTMLQKEREERGRIEKWKKRIVCAKKVGCDCFFVGLVAFGVFLFILLALCETPAVIIPMIFTYGALILIFQYFGEWRGSWWK